ncbi:AbrB family transcriptional regulator [Frigidibacter sp. MR17.24]|uniref:AbrB family transcriptional regulator n=1 Tax=Frigidibacter sp. MR17.24 TaxID=3127345 RepID=UPI003012F820
MSLRRPGRRPGRRPAHWLALAALGLACTAALGAVGAPSALLLGPIAAGMAFGLRGIALRFAPVPRAAAQGVTGVLIAQSLRPDTFAQLSTLWPAAVSVVGVTLLSAIAAGVMIGRMGAIDREEAIWGFLPGMAGAVIAMSEARNLDARAVAIVQVIRLIVVILGMSGLAAVLGGAGATGGAAAAAPPLAAMLVALGLVALAPLADRFARMIPAASMMVPMMAGVALKTAGLPIALPHGVIALAYFVIGAGVGLGFDRALLARAGRALPALVAAAAALVTLGATMGAGLGMLFGLDPLSGVLSAVPGSIDAVAAIGYSSHVDLSFVMTLQVFRLFAVVLFGPPLASFAARRFARPA